MCMRRSGMTKQEIINELAKLYRLELEGKNVQTLIEEMERLLCEKMGCEDEKEQD